MIDEVEFQRAVAAHRSGDLDDAERRYRSLLASAPGHPSLATNLASIRIARGHADEAVPLLEEAIALAPDHVNARSQLGLALMRLGRLDEAERTLDAALALDPAHLGALNNRALARATAGRHADAVGGYRRALEIAPNNVVALANLGASLLELGQLGEAEHHLRHALSIAPADPSSSVNLANVLTRRGRAAEAVLLLEPTLERHPDEAGWHSNLLLALHYAEGPSRAAVFEAHLRWAARHDRARPPPRRAAGPRPRRLRVGYVSPDLRSHAVAFFLAPLLAAHDRERFEIVAYASVAAEDRTSAKLRGLVDRWRNVHALGDRALADRMRRDELDLAVDLAGHTSGHRLGAFAERPAPVQLTYLGYPDTTGMTSIAYRLTDAVCDPPGSEAFCSERLLRIPDGMHVYEPPSDAPPVGPSPAASRGHLTFGSFANTSKVTEATVARWCRILCALPSSRLVMKFPTLADPSTAETYRGWFASRGVTPDRVTLRGATFAHGTHLAEHADVDAILDAFPYHGTTTTCEALWMGVPVLSLVGDRHVARVGASLSAQVGLERFAAPDEPALLERAKQLATREGLEELSRLRLSLRERMRRSPLCDGPSKARAIEACFEEAWSRSV